MEITPLGDSAALVRVSDNFDDAPEIALQRVLATQRCLADAKIPGVIEIAPSYITVGVFYDPSSVIAAGAPSDSLFEWLKQRISDVVSKIKTTDASGGEVTEIEIPVCYDPEFAFDLEDVAQHANLNRNEVVDLHSGVKYRVHCVGFIGGFAFLGGLPAKLATPRRETPRKEIPAGSVGIGAKQTGIYPIKSPGGWNIIGRTPLHLFDPLKNPPGLLREGDRVRFRPISREEFERSSK